MFNQLVTIAAVAFILGGAAAGLAQGWRYGAKISAMERHQAMAMASAHNRAVETSQRVAALDEKYHTELEKAHEENRDLMRDVESGRKRLHVKARCPAMPQATTRSGVGDATSPQLDAAAKQDYYTLREGIRQVTTQLGACQEILKQERG